MGYSNKYIEDSFPPPSNQGSCLDEIAQATWQFAACLEEYKPDYIQELIEMASEPDEELDEGEQRYITTDDQIAVYSEVHTIIREDLGEFFNRSRSFHDTFFQQREKVVSVIKDEFALHIVIEIFALIQDFTAKLDETLEEYEADMCYSSFEDDLEALKKYFGKGAIKLFKKYSEVTIEQHQWAFDEITAFTKYVNECRFSFKLNELARKLVVFCELKIPDFQQAGAQEGEAKEQKPVTLLEFMQRHCEKQKPGLLKYRRKSLNDANNRGTIQLPEPVKDWKSGQSKHYIVSNLKEKWPSFCEALPNLPPLRH